MIVEITAAARIIAADIAVTNYSIIPRAGGIICQKICIENMDSSKSVENISEWHLFRMHIKLPQMLKKP